ncbi:hypothetical protein Btru_006864 [Bulinus truncatus]|nr:hypothetical protein Btru_006864 [Bulinus truncatus]
MVIQTNGHLVKWSSRQMVIQTNGHPVKRSSRQKVIQSNGHLDKRSSRQTVIQLICWPDFSDGKLGHNWWDNLWELSDTVPSQKPSRRASDTFTSVCNVTSTCVRFRNVASETI